MRNMTSSISEKNKTILTATSSKTEQSQTAIQREKPLTNKTIHTKDPSQNH